ncbi:MAG TPA: NAD(P)H-binding protein [Gemmataceae bacterium]|nr:NAD(P)H-binding protein [Gemmataceae bacterium]
MPNESGHSEAEQRPMILLTAATGYVGGRLIPLLEESGVVLRCLARTPEKLRPRVAPSTEPVQGDVLDPASLEQTMQGVTTACNGLGS